MIRLLAVLLLSILLSPATGADWFAPNGWTPPDTNISGPKTGSAFEGEGPLALSVEQAVALALANNPSLISQRQEPIIAGTFAAVERAVFDPELFAGASGSEEGEVAEAGVRKQLPTGTTLELTLAQAFAGSGPRNSDTQVALTVTQALLDGFGIATNLVSLRQARTDVVASAYQLRGFVTALVADVELTYWNYLGARARIDILEKAVAVAERRAQATEARIAAGAAAEIQRYIFAAEAAQRRQALIDGRAAARRLRTELLRLISPSGAAPYRRGVEPTSTVTVEQTAPIDLAGAYIELAWQRRANLNQARLLRVRQELQIVATSNGLLPRLDLFVTLGQGASGDFTAADFDERDGGESYDLTAGLQFQYPLGNRSAEARFTRAQANRLQARAAIDNLRRLIAAQVRTAVIEVERAAAQIEASAVTVRLREKTEQAARTRFDIGRGTALQVAQAQRDLLAARLNRLAAFISYRQALIDLHVADGTLLTRRLIDAPGRLPPHLPWQ